MTSVRFTIASIVCAAAALGACSTDGRTMKAPTQSQIAAISPGTTVLDQVDDVIEQTAPLTLTAPWVNGTAIDPRYSCDGEALSPPLAWNSAPPDTQAFGIVLTDQDRPEYIHWVMTNIDPTVTTVTEGSNPTSAFVAMNSENTLGYSAPCPPRKATHSYSITLYALKSTVDTTKYTSAASIIEQMDGLVREVATTDFTYSR